MRSITRALMLGCAVVMLGLVASVPAQEKAGKLRFGVGPLQPTPGETKKAYDPFFKYLAEKLGRDYDLVATTDWAGISVALANKQVDLAWMGPWGYVLANDDSGAQAIATAKYDGKPIYHAIVVCKPGLVKSWPDGAKGASLHQVHLAMQYADRIIALRSGALIEDAPAASFDRRALGQIYERADATSITSAG